MRWLIVGFVVFDIRTASRGKFKGLPAGHLPAAVEGANRLDSQSLCDRTGKVPESKLRKADRADRPDRIGDSAAASGWDDASAWLFPS